MQNRQIVIAAISFALAIISVRTFWHHTWLLFVVLIAISMLALWNTEWRFVKTYVLVSFLGPLAEVFCLIFDTGIWQYSTNTAFGVPVWLAPLWGVASLCFITVGMFFHEVKAE